MKRSTLIIAVLTILSPGAIWAEVQQEDEGVPAKSISTPQAPPLLLAQALPGMRDLPQPVSKDRLPGMSPAAAPVLVLPQPMISELTNYPNPFDSRKPGLEGQTVIAYQLANPSHVSLEIYDLLGHKVRGWDLAAGDNGGRQGLNSIPWDGTNAAGRKVSKGGYIAQLVIEAPQSTVTVVRKIGVIH